MKPTQLAEQKVIQTFAYKEIQIVNNQFARKIFFIEMWVKCLKALNKYLMLVQWIYIKLFIWILVWKKFYISEQIKWLLIQQYFVPVL